MRPGGDLRRAVAVLAGPPILFFAAFFAAPMVVVLVASVTDAKGGPTAANYARILLDQYHWEVLWVTFRIGLLTTIASVAIGYPLAWYLVRIVRWRPWRRTCVILLVIPLFTSNIVRSFGWMVLLGRNGLVNDGLVASGLVERPLRFLGTELGILIGLVYILLPFIVLAVGNALAKIDPSLEQASADLGARPAATFWTVTFPLSLPGLTAGAVMVFMLAVSAYVTPALLSGGRITVFSMLIFQQYSSVFDFHYGGALGITMLALTLILVAIAGRIGDAKGG
jgi:putative spermidine/putrescine transport system permease protein